MVKLTEVFSRETEKDLIASWGWVIRTSCKLGKQVGKEKLGWIN